MFHFLEYLFYAEALTIVLIFKITTFDLHLFYLLFFFISPKFQINLSLGLIGYCSFVMCGVESCKIYYERIAYDRMLANTALCVPMDCFSIWSGLEWYWVFDIQRIVTPTKAVILSDFENKLDWKYWKILMEIHVVRIVEHIRKNIKVMSKM